jgi:Cytochrome c554 and c-prime/LVIVD repeat
MRGNRFSFPMLRRGLAALLLAGLLSVGGDRLTASGGEHPHYWDYSNVTAPPAPEGQSDSEAEEKSAGCKTCHTASDQSSMHTSEAVVLGCTDCHGGNASIKLAEPSLDFQAPAYVAVMKRAHVLPRYMEGWDWPSSANPKRSYVLFNKESPEFIRFTNPSDYRVARESCGACHMKVIEATERSLMATGAMLWGGAGYNNGIVPLKNYAIGEAYTRHGEPACIVSPSEEFIPLKEGEKTRPCRLQPTLTAEQKARGALPLLYPLPAWQTVNPGDVFRVFERGGRNIQTQFAEVGLPNPTGSIQRLEEPGRPDLKQSSRGPGTGIRVAIPVLNIHKTRLNDPFMWFQGTNDQPGDYRQSGCAGCHVIYANDREPRHSLTYAQYGRDGQTATVDPTIANRLAKDRPHHVGENEEGYIKRRPPPAHTDQAYGNADAKESGHPIKHAFTRAIPTAQCMNCHMHQPNIFLNSYLGYTMWDYESDAPAMWPGPENTAAKPADMSDADYQRLYKQQRYPTAEEVRETNERNPEAAAAKGLWSDVNFLRNVYDLNSELKDTQFADYHGHGWNFRAILKRDREGNLLDAEGKIVSNDDPEKFRRTGEAKFVKEGTNPGKSVHMMDIHAEKGLQCADCHFSQDGHGNGMIYGEVANAIEIGCKDCHGTADAYPTLLTSGPAAPPAGNNLTLIRNADGKRRFEWFTNDDGEKVLIQRSIIDPSIEWRVSLVKDSVTKGNKHFNMKAARAKLTGSIATGTGYGWGPGVAKENRAHSDEKVACFTCHLSWTTSCGGCHLPIEANWKTKGHKYDGEETRNFATYNPQVARDDMFQLGKHQTTKGNIIAPIRSTSALILSSTNVNRERIYVQQPPISAAGYSSQAFAPHFPHTVRTTETKMCSDCHIAETGDNNAIMAQTLLLGTNFVNFVGLHAWTGLSDGFEAVRVTEWDEPQAVIGSHLHRYSTPDYFKMHVERNGRELKNWTRGKTFDSKFSGETQPNELFENVVQGTKGQVGCLQLRGEYMFVAEGKGGFRAYDVASIGNKGFSERIISAPFAAKGQNTHVKSSNATCVALSTTQPISYSRNAKIVKDYPENEEQSMHPLYKYAVVTDSVEGLILVDIDTLADGEFRNNFFKRDVVWNPDNILAGARHVTLAGTIAYITTASGLVTVDLNDPMNPKLLSSLPLRDARASAVQFRYLWVTDAEGLKLFDITQLGNPVPVPSGTVPLTDARKIYLARTYAYVAAKAEGLVIVNIKRPEAPEIYQKVTLDGQLNDAEDVIVGTTNASLFAYVADGRNGMKVLQLTSPSSQPNFYGYSPAPKPEMIAWTKTPSPALSLSKGLDRDRGVDETGNQMAVFGRLGSRPFTRKEMERLFLSPRGIPYKVTDDASLRDYVPLRSGAR